MTGRNHLALCALAKHYDDMEALGLPFYEQGTWGYAITPDADYAEATSFLAHSRPIGNDDDLERVLDLIYTEHTCFTFGCVAGNAAAAMGYEGRKYYNRGPGFFDWSEVRLKGSPEHTHFMSVSTVAAELLGFTWQEQEFMFGSEWEPKEGLSMGSVLRRLAGGASMLFVSHDDYVMHGFWRFDLDDLSNEELKYLVAIFVENDEEPPDSIINQLERRGVLA